MLCDDKKSRENDKADITLEAAFVGEPVDGANAFTGRRKVPSLATQPQLSAVSAENRPEN